MQAPRGRGSIALLILDLGSRWGEWSASRPRRALLPGKDPGTHWIGGWACRRAGLDTEARGKIFCVCLGLNPGHPVCS
jgi:hypothetical protein